MMSDIAAILASYPRIHFACRNRVVADPESGSRASVHQARILQYLDVEDPVMVGELAEHLGVTASTMSITLKRMEAAGFILRDKDPNDRRVTNVRLSERGARTRENRSMLDPERVAALMARLTPEQRAAAVYGMRLLAEAAERQVGDRTDHHQQGDWA